MAVMSKEYLTGHSGNGTGIKIADSGAATTIHTVPASVVDEVWLWAYNSHSATLTLTLQWGGTTSPDDDIKVDLEPQDGLILVAPGLPLAAALVVKAYGSTTNLITIHGYVNRIT